MHFAEQSRVHQRRVLAGPRVAVQVERHEEPKSDQHASLRRAEASSHALLDTEIV